MTSEHSELLDEARQRTAALLEQLGNHQRDLESAHRPLTAEQVHEGQAALAATVDASRQLLHSIELALSKDATDPSQR